jgi:2-C-methyl-D-erythritol 4-phosphate cytidylyltransferase
MSDPISGACYALVPAAGIGSRAGTAGPKQYERLCGRAVIAHTLSALRQVPRLRATLVVLAADDDRFESHVEAAAAASVWPVRCGGASRAASVEAGLDALRTRGAADADWVLVHDAARCLLRPAAVERLIDACLADAIGGLLALPLADTLKAAGEGQPARVQATVPREGKWLAQTPQMFRLAVLHRALCEARERGLAVTDEASAIEAMGLQPLLVPGDWDNFKLTWPADFALAERLLEPMR